MSDLAFTVELVENIAGPSKMGQDALRKLQEQAKAAGNALDFSAQSKAAVNSFTALKLDPKGFTAAYAANKAIAAEQKKLIRAHEGFFGGLKSAVASPFANTTSAVAMGELLGAGIIKGAGLLVDAGLKVAGWLKDGVVLGFESGGKQEHLQNSFKYIFGGEAGAKAAFAQSEAIAPNLPFGGMRTAGYIGSLGKAGIKGQSATNALALAADAGALSPDGSGTEEALAALERLKRHGEFSPRLAEGLNVNLTDLYAALGKKLNLTAAEAQKKLGEPGKIGFNTILNSLMDVHSQAMGGALTGSAAIDQSKELMQRWERIKELPEEYLRSVANAPGWSKLSDTLGDVLDRLDPKKHPEIVNGLIDSFSHLAQQARDILTPENINRFTKSLEQLPAQLGRVADSLGATVKLLGAAADLIGLIPGATAKPTSGNAVDSQAPSKWNEAVTVGAAAASSAWSIAKPGLMALYPEWLFGSDDDDKKKQAEAGNANTSWWDRDLFGKSGSKPSDAASAGVPSAPNQQRAPITLSPTINVTVQAAPGSTAEDHGRTVAEVANKHMANELEKAAQQSGAM